MEALANLGIDPKIMLAQAVNFFALLAILSFFVYKPILKVLDERKDRIKKTEENATKIEKQLAKTEELTAKELQKAQKQASEIVANAKKSAKEIEEKLVAEAKVKVEKVVEEGRSQIKKEREEASAGLQSEVAKIVLLATEKLLGREVKEKDQTHLVAEAVKELEKIK